MRNQFTASQFVRLTSDEQISMCRAMAVEAEGLALHADYERRRIYEDLARHWFGLAGVIARMAVRATRH